jgi:hypothetical protein
MLPDKGFFCLIGFFLCENPKKKIFLVKKKKYISPQKNNFPEIYFLVVKYRVFVKTKPYQAKNPIRQKTPLSGNMTLPTIRFCFF